MPPTKEHLGQQLQHKRGSGLFYCHLKTFKKRLSLPKTKTKQKELRKWDLLTVPWKRSLGAPGAPASFPSHICPMWRNRQARGHHW